MERLLYDPKASDVAVAWRAAHFTGRGGAITELSRKKLQVHFAICYSQIKSKQFAINLYAVLGDKLGTTDRTRLCSSSGS